MLRPEPDHQRQSRLQHVSPSPVTRQAHQSDGNFLLNWIKETIQVQSTSTPRRIPITEAARLNPELTANLLEPDVVYMVHLVDPDIIPERRGFLGKFYTAAYNIAREADERSRGTGRGLIGSTNSSYVYHIPEAMALLIGGLLVGGSVFFHKAATELIPNLNWLAAVPWLGSMLLLGAVAVKAEQAKRDGRMAYNVKRGILQNLIQRTRNRSRTSNQITSIFSAEGFQRLFGLNVEDENHRLFAQILEKTARDAREKPSSVHWTDLHGRKGLEMGYGLSYYLSDASIQVDDDVYAQFVHSCCQLCFKSLRETVMQNGSQATKHFISDLAEVTSREDLVTLFRALVEANQANQMTVFGHTPSATQRMSEKIILSLYQKFLAQDL